MSLAKRRTTISKIDRLIGPSSAGTDDRAKSRTWTESPHPRTKFNFGLSVPEIQEDKPMSTKSEISPNSPSSLILPTSKTRNRHRRYREGSLVTERRKECSHKRTTRCPHCVWVYRFFEYIDGMKIRRKENLGTVEQLPSKDDAKRACEPLRMSANAENPRPNVTMQGLIDLYIEKVIRPCLNVPIGGVQDPSARMGYSCAGNYKGQLRNWIGPRWKDYPVSDFERPEIWSAAEEWFQSLRRSANNPGGLAPKTVRVIFAVMGQLMKFAVKWGYLKQNPFAGKAGQERRIDPPRGSTLRLSKAAQYTAAQAFELVQHLALRERTATTFAAWLGPRGSETFGLKWMDLNLTAAVVSFRRGFDRGRVTPGKTLASDTEMPLPDEVVQSLKEWQSATPYNRPDDWVFASWAKKGKTPIARAHLIRYYIQPVARKLGFPKVTWYSFRHSLSAWGKECLNAEERKVLLRHASIKSGEGYGEIPLETKHVIAQRLWAHMRLAGQQNLGGAATASSDVLIVTGGHSLPSLALEPSQSRTPHPSALAFGEGTVFPVLGEHDTALALQTLEHEKRSAAARKAWVTIRANKAAKKAAAPQGRRDPCLTQNSRKEVA